MICERCGRFIRVYFYVQDQAAWNRLSPYGDSRGQFCLECADDLAIAAGLRNIPTLIGFQGKGLSAPNGEAYVQMVRAGYLAAPVRSP